MQYKTYYFRDRSSGQYVAGLSKLKAWSMFGLIVFIIGGVAYSMSVARSLASADSVPVIASATSTHSVDPSSSDCVLTSNRSYDCTTSLVKDRIYLLTSGGRKALKWYGASKAMTVTGYSSRVQETDSTPEIGATGENIWHLLQAGVRVCASNDFKLGTVVDVSGLGRCVIKDRMNSRYTGKGHIDWYFGYDTASALQFGRQVLAVSYVD